MKDIENHQRIYRKYWLKCLDLQKISNSWHCSFKPRQDDQHGIHPVEIEERKCTPYGLTGYSRLHGGLCPMAQENNTGDSSIFLHGWCLSPLSRQPIMAGSIYLNTCYTQRSKTQRKRRNEICWLRRRGRLVQWDDSIKACVSAILQYLLYVLLPLPLSSLFTICQNGRRLILKAGQHTGEWTPKEKLLLIYWKVHALGV